MISRTSALNVRRKVRRNPIHPQTGSWFAHAPPDVAAAPLTVTFTLANAQSVAFYLDDTAFPYFGDDAGGVSLAVNLISTSVPEPGSIAMLLTGVLGLGFVARRSSRV